MTAPRRALAPALLYLLALTSPAVAGTISIGITPAVELKDGELTARVGVSNSGDEPALSVGTVLTFGEQQARSELRKALAPNEAMETALALRVGDLAPGRWPYRVAVDYADGNQYPFQAVHTSLVTVGSPPPAKVAIPLIRSEGFGRNGTLRVTVKNLAGVAREAALRVTLPDGVEVTKPLERVALAPWAEAQVAVPLVNRTALPGSRYPAFAIVEYDEDGVHQAVVAQGLVSIVAEESAVQSLFQTQRSLFWLVASFIAVVWIGILIGWTLARRRGRAAPPA